MIRRLMAPGDLMKGHVRPTTKQQPEVAAAAGRRDASKRRRTQVERSTETRRKLIEAAIQLVHEAGFGRLTINDVARRAGLTSGAVQHHFESSRALLRAVAEAVYPVFQLSIDEVANTKWSTKRRVDRFVDLFWGVYRTPEYLVFWEFLFGTRDNPDLREVLLAMQKDTVNEAVANLTKVFADLRLSQDGAFDLWTFVTSQLRGLALLSMFEEKTVLDADVRILKDAAHQLFLKLTKS
jgi:AcrR family transcriptional regulator